MEYKYFGWNENALPLNDAYKDINSPRDLYDALSYIWCEYTCAPRMRKDWSRENRTLGQCSITAFLAQDIFGGDVYGVPLKDGGFHCYNKVGDSVFDLTSEQFKDEILNYNCENPQSREKHFASEEKQLRYEYLKRQLKEYCMGHIPTQLPGGFFIYNNDEKEEILYAEENVINLLVCFLFVNFA